MSNLAFLIDCLFGDLIEKIEEKGESWVDCWVVNTRGTKKEKQDY